MCVCFDCIDPPVYSDRPMVVIPPTVVTYGGRVVPGTSAARRGFGSLFPTFPSRVPAPPGIRQPVYVGGPSRGPTVNMRPQPVPRGPMPNLGGRAVPNYVPASRPVLTSGRQIPGTGRVFR